MRQSQLFTKTRRQAPKDEVAKNAQLLIRAGFIHKEMAGVYSYLPLGLRVFNKIEQIIREEINAIGGQELAMSALQDKTIWERTDRWDDAKVDNWFKSSLRAGGEVGFGFTHEEPLTRMMRDHIASWRDLPVYAYQFQTKFRNEERAKSGLLRTREFVMKDLYSFSTDADEHILFYERVAEAYKNIFKRIGIGADTYTTFASGGSFAKYSHEFQTVCDAGEDTIYIDDEKGLAINKEVLNEEVLADLGVKRGDLREAKAVEVGNIFTLGTRFSEALGLLYTDEKGVDVPVVMGSYGTAPGRLLAVAVELLGDEKSLNWPESIAPFQVHVLELSGEDPVLKDRAEKIYEALQKAGVEVLYDDRDVRAGEKFTDADLLGMPMRIVVGAKAGEGMVEFWKRGEESKTISDTEAIRHFSHAR